MPETSNSGLTLTRATETLRQKNSLDEEAFIVAGYENLSKDFNVFLVGDASLATFPANESPRVATTAALSIASMNNLITQVSWVKHAPAAQAGR